MAVSAAVTVGITGDIMILREPSGDGYPAVLDALHACDAVMVNLETTLTERGGAADKLIRFRSDPKVVEHLVSANVTVANVANNHSLDYGVEGLLDTVDNLVDAGITSIGGGPDIDTAIRPGVVERGGLRFSMIGFASTLPVGSSAGPGRPGITPVRVLSRFLVDTVTIDEQPGMAPLVETTPFAEDVERLEQAVAQAKAESDVVIVTCHWGVPRACLAPYQGHLCDYQRPVAHRLIDAGADAVLGHHPHSLSEVEFYRDRPIFYSLGNFLFQARAVEDREYGRAEPDYDLSKLHDELTKVGGLARLTWTGPGAPSHVDMVSVAIDTAGNPSIADSKQHKFASGIVRELSGSTVTFTDAAPATVIAPVKGN
jgi:poly-gamma-glutamate capsule biosynthesis protein CapA/YwtB (metallophosphatase superfamily)